MTTLDKKPDALSDEARVKLEKLSSSLVPFLVRDPDFLSFMGDFLDGLKNESTNPRIPTPHTPHISKHSLYMPEIDYTLYQWARTGRLRQCGFAAQGNKYDGAYIMGRDDPNNGIPYGLRVMGGNFDPRIHYVVPVATLKRLITAKYAMPYALDYRLSAEARTMYMKGIYDFSADDGLGGKATKNLYARVIDYTPTTQEHIQQIVKATRDYWTNHMPDDGGVSIVTKATMMELLDKFELGEMTPGTVPWHIDIRNNGQKNEANTPLLKMDIDHCYTPMKISIARTE